MTADPTPADPNDIEKLTESTGAGPTHYGEFLGAEPLADTPPLPAPEISE